MTEWRVEAARSEMAAASQQQACIVCCAAQRDTFLNCGHLVCRQAADPVSVQPHQLPANDRHTGVVGRDTASARACVPCASVALNRSKAAGREWARRVATR